MQVKKTLVCLTALAMTTACTTITPNSINEVPETAVRACRFVGNISGADAIFVGLSSSIGSKNAKAKAINEAVKFGATNVVWSQMGTSMTNEWIGKAYVCK